MSEPTRDEQIVYLTEWAAKNGGTLQIHGQVGFGREATGILVDGAYPDTGPAKEKTCYMEHGGPWWQPEDAYHKHDCLCVLGHEYVQLRQLYNWVKWLDENHYKVAIEYRQPSSDIDLLIHGTSRAFLVREKDFA
jgi:hypothetical protein